MSTRLRLLLSPSLIGGTACNAKANPVAAGPPPCRRGSAATAGQQTAVISGGCFWGVQAVFQHVKGVISATSGYAGGTAKTTEYEIVSAGETGHAESVQIVFDPHRSPTANCCASFSPWRTTRHNSIVKEQTREHNIVRRSSTASDEQKRIAEAYIQTRSGQNISRVLW